MILAKEPVSPIFIASKRPRLWLESNFILKFRLVGPSFQPFMCAVTGEGTLVPHKSCDTDCELGGAAGTRRSRLLMLCVGGSGVGSALGHGKGRVLLKQGRKQQCPEKL